MEHLEHLQELLLLEAQLMQDAAAHDVYETPLRATIPLRPAGPARRVDSVFEALRAVKRATAEAVARKEAARAAAAATTAGGGGSSLADGGDDKNEKKTSNMQPASASRRYGEDEAAAEEEEEEEEEEDALAVARRRARAAGVDVEALDAQFAAAVQRARTPRWTRRW